MTPAEIDRVERMLLMHLLEHHGQQVRFEASPWVTEFGIVRRFPDVPSDSLRRALRTLEMGRLVYRRTQYVVGYSEPKQVYSLTPSGHRKAVEVQEGQPATDADLPATPALLGDGSPSVPSSEETEQTGPDRSIEPTV